MIIRPRKMEEFSAGELLTIMQRSAQDISSVYEHVRSIVQDVKLRGDAALLESNRELKGDMSAAELRVSEEEIDFCRYLKSYDMDELSEYF